jgi:hypothetical protein
MLRVQSRGGLRKNEGGPQTHRERTMAENKPKIMTRKRVGDLALALIG